MDSCGSATTTLWSLIAVLRLAFLARAGSLETDQSATWKHSVCIFQVHGYHEESHDRDEQKIVHRLCCDNIGHNSSECWPGSDVDPIVKRFYTPEHCCFRPFVGINFAIVGFPKTGSTAFVNMLNQHPEIGIVSPSWAKEDDALTTEPHLSESKLAAYHRYVKGHTKRTAKVIGVKNVWMVYKLEQMWRLAQIPNLKIIVLLRHPIRLLESLWNLYVADCYAATDSDLCCPVSSECASMSRPLPVLSSFEQLLLNEHFSRADISIAHGHMFDFLETTCFPFFSRENVLLLNVGGSTVHDLQRTTDFLGVSAFATNSLTALISSRSNVNKRRFYKESIDLCDGSQHSQALLHALEGRFARSLPALRQVLRARNESILLKACP